MMLAGDCKALRFLRKCAQAYSAYKVVLITASKIAQHNGLAALRSINGSLFLLIKTRLITH